MRLLLLPTATLATLLLLWLAKPVLVPVLFALLFAQLLTPLARLLERRLPVLLAAILAMAMLATLIVATMSLIASQISLLETNLPAIGARISQALVSMANEFGRYFGLGKLSQKILVENGFSTYLTYLGSGSAAALMAVSFTISTLVEATLVVILTFLMLYYRRHFHRQIRRLGERSGTYSLRAMLDRTAELGQSYVAGLGIVMVIVGVADAVGLLLVGAPFAALFGLLGALSVLVPYVGIAITAPLCALIAWLVTGSAGIGGGVLLVLAVVHFFEGNLISPMLVGSRVNLNPLATIVAVLVGGQLWGPAGMILFIPLTGIIKLALDSVPAAEPYSRMLGPVTATDLQGSGRTLRARLRRAAFRPAASVKLGPG